MVELALRVEEGVDKGVPLLVLVGEPVGVCVCVSGAVALPDCEALPDDVDVPVRLGVRLPLRVRVLVCVRDCVADAVRV